MYYIVVLLIIIIFITVQSFILQSMFKNITNLIQTIDNTNDDIKVEINNINNTINHTNSIFKDIHKHHEYSNILIQTEYQTIDDVPKNKLIYYFNLREIAKQCTTDILDLADPKYDVAGKYVITCHIEGNNDDNETIRHIKNIDKVNFRFCEQLDYLFTNFSNLETIDGLERMDISNVYVIQAMFSFCHSLKYIDISFWDLSHHNIKSMFYDCDSLETVIISSESINKIKDEYKEIFGKANPCIIAKV